MEYSGDGVLEFVATELDMVDTLGSLSGATTDYKNSLGLVQLTPGARQGLYTDFANGFLIQKTLQTAVTWLTQGNGNPTVWMQAWLYYATYAVLLLTLIVVVIPLFTGEGDWRRPEDW